MLLVKALRLRLLITFEFLFEFSKPGIESLDVFIDRCLAQEFGEFVQVLFLMVVFADSEFEVFG